MAQVGSRGRQRFVAWMPGLYANVTLVVSDRAYFNRYARKWGRDPLEEREQGRVIFTDTESGHEAVVFLREWRPNADYVAILAHELVHVIDAICEARNMIDTETRGHAMQYMMNRFLNCLYRRRKGAA